MLRRLDVSDIAAFASYRSDPVLAMYQGWSAMSDAEAHKFLDEMSRATLLQPCVWCQLGITEDASHALVGDVGLCVSKDGASAEIGFTLRRESHGRGVASRAVLAAMKFVFENTTAARAIAITDARNLPCIRLLERIGMQKSETCDTLFKGEPCVEHTYVMLRQARTLGSNPALVNPEKLSLGYNPAYESPTVQLFAPSAAKTTAINITIRTASPADALCLSVLATHVFLDTYAKDGVHESLAREVQQTLSVAACAQQLADQNMRTAVAESAGRLIAFYQLRITASHALVTSSSASELVRVYVHERFTSHGVGTKLLQHAESLALENGADSLWLTAWADNARALAFYARRGYKDAGATDYVFENARFENRLFVKLYSVNKIRPD